jgi:Permease MlaE
MGSTSLLRFSPSHPTRTLHSKPGSPLFPLRTRFAVKLNRHQLITRLCHPGSIVNNSPTSSSPLPSSSPPVLFANWTPPRALWRGLSALVLAGQVAHRVLTGRVHRRNTLQQLQRVGPGSTGVSLLTATFVGMAFTIQFVREFTRLGLHRSVGGVLALALSRELSPVVTAVVAAGRIGSAFAAELGTMQVCLTNNKTSYLFIYTC